jgi:heme O synthase-like polyprenyltransferase
MSLFPLPISFGGFMILLALLYGAWMLIKATNFMVKASNMSTGTMFLIVKIVLVAILVAIIVSYSK